MLNKLALNTLLLTLFSFLSFISSAQQRNFSVNKNEPTWLRKIVTTSKKPAKRDIQDGYFLFLYEQQQNLEQQEMYEHVIREIDSDNGVQNGSEISATYDPSYQKLIFHKVIIWRNNQPINKLIAKNFKVMQNEKELAKFIYSGTFDAYLILDDVRKGDRIEYAYTVKGENPVFAGRYSNTIYFEWGSKLSNLYFNVIAKKDRVLYFKNFHNVPPLKTKEENGYKIYEWQSELTKTIKEEDYEPSWYNPYSRIQISEAKTWKEIVDWGLQLNNYDLKNAVVLNKKIKQLKDQSKGNNERYLELAARFVQDEVRYMGIEMGEFSHRPNSPEKVLKQRYGDCKDKTLLLGCLLRGNGINAYSVYVNTYLKDKTKDLLPTTTAFNHEILLVEFEGKKIWIDPTMSDQGGNIRNNYFPYNANVLVIKPGNDKLEWVKSNPTGKLSSFSVFKLADTLEGNKSELTIKSTYTANYADELRSEISSSGIDKLEKDYLEYYSKTYPSITSTKDLTVVDDKKNNVISLIENYEIEDIWIKEDSTSNKYYAYFYGDMIHNELRELSKSRNIPFALKYPVNIHQHIKVLLPSNWTIEDEEDEIDRKNYHFDYSIKHHLDTLELDYHYQNKHYELQGADTKQYVKDKKTILSDVSYSIYWKGQAGAAADEDINYMLLSISMVAFIVGAIAGIFIYINKKPFDLEAIKTAPNIGGWLVLVIISLFFTPIAILTTIGNSSIFSQSTWTNIGDLSKSTAMLYKGMFVFEAIGNTLLLVFSLLLIPLFLNRRSIIPKYFIRLKIASVIITIVDVVLIYLIRDKIGNEISMFSEIIRLVWSVILSTIWILYFLKSTRVKQTFVFTYPNFAWRNELIKEMSANINVPFPNSAFHSYQELKQEEKDDEQPKI